MIMINCQKKMKNGFKRIQRIKLAIEKNVQASKEIIKK